MISRIDSLSVNELLTQPIIVSPTEHIHKAIGLMRRTKSYELFVMEQGEDTGTRLKSSWSLLGRRLHSAR
jgi:CBS domain-containing protein